MVFLIRLCKSSHFSKLHVCWFFYCKIYYNKLLIDFWEFLFVCFHITFWNKVKKILKGSLNLISSPSVKIQIMGGKVCLRRRGKTLLCIINKIFVFKSLLTTSSNVLTLHLSRMWFWIFTEHEGDGIESRLSSEIFLTLTVLMSTCAKNKYRTFFFSNI